MIKYTLQDGNSIDVPQHIKELTLEQYLGIRHYTSRPEFAHKTDFEIQYFILQSVIDFPLDDLTIKELNEVSKLMEGMVLGDVYNLSSKQYRWKINGIEYGAYVNFDNYDYREPFYIDQIVMSGNEADYVPKILAALIRPYTKVPSKEFPQLDRIKLDDLMVEDIEPRSSLFLKMKIEYIYHIINDYYKWKQGHVASFSNLYSRKPKDEKGEMLQTIKIHPKWGPIAMLDRLCNGDVTKTEEVLDTNYISILFRMCYWDVKDEYYYKINKSR